MATDRALKVVIVVADPEDWRGNHQASTATTVTATVATPEITAHLMALLVCLSPAEFLPAPVTAADRGLSFRRDIERSVPYPGWLTLFDGRAAVPDA
jgi:hypothetical protein